MKKIAAFALSMCWSLSGVSPSSVPVSSIFVHGWGGSAQQAFFYAENNTIRYANAWHKRDDISGRFILKHPIYSFDLPHVYGRPASKYVSLAQDIEIASLQEMCEAVPGPKILMGVSMGASTIINYTSLYYTPDIKALVAETPFDEAEVVLKHQTGVLYDMLKWTLRDNLASAYDPAGIKPIVAIHKLPKDLPILLIHASTDELIPLRCSRHLYYHLANNGHRYVHLLELSSGKHAHYVHGKDAQKYQETVHAFYKRYNLPYDAALAHAGKKYLDDSQPPAW